MLQSSINCKTTECSLAKGCRQVTPMSLQIFKVVQAEAEWRLNTASWVGSTETKKNLTSFTLNSEHEKQQQMLFTERTKQKIGKGIRKAEDSWNSHWNGGKVEDGESRKIFQSSGSVVGAPGNEKCSLRLLVMKWEGGATSFKDWMLTQIEPISKV